MYASFTRRDACLKLYAGTFTSHAFKYDMVFYFIHVMIEWASRHYIIKGEVYQLAFCYVCPFPNNQDKYCLQEILSDLLLRNSLRLLLRQQQYDRQLCLVNMTYNLNQ